MATLNNDVVIACRAAARDYKVPLPTIIGIVRQESGGKFSYSVDGKQEPAVRHEGHYFYKRLSGAIRTAAVKKGLASPKVGGIPNPAGQQARWDKLLQPAMAMDKAAEIESVSWGLGQVMGAHWKRLKFSSAEALMNHTRKGITEQVDLMMRYVKEFGLIDELQRGDIEGFVRGYNGPGNVANYSASIRKLIKLAAAEYGTKTEAAKQVDGVPVNNVAKATEARTFLRMGIKHDARVREAQALLGRDGYAVAVDGDFGPSTRDAVKGYQKEHGLTVDGMIGPETWERLNERRLSPDEKPGIPGIAETITQTPEGRQGAATATAGLGVTGLSQTKETVQTATDALLPVTGSGVTIIDTIYTVLTVLGVVIVIGGGLWVAYGFFKARRIDHRATNPPADAI